MTGPDLQFITFKNADDFKSRTKRKAIRAHIIKQNLERRKGGFKNTYLKGKAHGQHKNVNDPSTVVTPTTNIINAIHVEMLDPFESLPVDQSELQSLLHHPLAQEAVEPVFNISAPFSFHDLHGAYANAFTDVAFSNALMCAISLAKHDYTFAPKVLHYQGLAIESINQQLQSPSSYEFTIGAILLLVGVEWRTGSNDKARIHLRGIEKLLQVCQSEQRILSATVRRGIFWQDVNTAIVTAKDRVMHRDTFPEFLWGRSTFRVDWARLPPGFEELRGKIGKPEMSHVRDVYTLLQDIYVLQKHGEALICSKPDLDLIHNMDNMQACIESRLLEQLQDDNDDPLRVAVLLTTFIYTYSLFTQVWNGSAIPLHIASRLLEQLHLLSSVHLHNTQRRVLLWCTFTAGCLLPESAMRSDYGALLRSCFRDLLSAPSINAAWFTISGTLDQYFWSQANFGDRGLAFLRENYDLDGMTSNG